MNVQRTPSCIKIFLETLEFPSVWECVEALNKDEFQSYADRNPDVLGAHNCDFPILNKVAEQVAGRLAGVLASTGSWASLLFCQRRAAGRAEDYKHVNKAAADAKDMIRICAAKGANVNEVDRKNGLTPLYHIAKVAAKHDGCVVNAAAAAAAEMADVLVACGQSQRAAPRSE